MTDRKITQRRRLSHEILGLIGISALVAAIVFLVLSRAAAAIAENYCFYHDVPMTEFDWLEVDRWIFGVSGALSAVVFSLLFLALLSDRMAYIRTITAGIDNLRMGDSSDPLPLEGKNELTQLADAINYLSDTQRQLRQKEQALAREKEQFIRTLSHDIRTPLTSILAYAEYLSGAESVSPEEQKSHLETIGKKAEQIRDLTGLLLDGDKRNPERFENAHLLMQQLAAEFEESLEGRFAVQTDLSGCGAFAGAFDVQQMRRIFDNLSSNVHKYADPGAPVLLQMYLEQGALCIRQKNRIAASHEQPESYKLGIHSIRRIAQSYGGRVEVQQDRENFSITVILSEF